RSGGLKLEADGKTEAAVAAAASPTRGGGPAGSSVFKGALVRRYGLAVTSVIIAFAAQLVLAPAFDEQAPFLLFVVAVLVADGVGGLGPGLVATGLAGMLAVWAMPAFPDLARADIVAVAAFLAI